MQYSVSCPVTLRLANTTSETWKSSGKSMKESQRLVMWATWTHGRSSAPSAFSASTAVANDMDVKRTSARNTAAASATQSTVVACLTMTIGCCSATRATWRPTAPFHTSSSYASSMTPAAANTVHAFSARDNPTSRHVATLWAAAVESAAVQCGIWTRSAQEQQHRWKGNSNHAVPWNHQLTAVGSPQAGHMSPPSEAHHRHCSTEHSQTQVHYRPASSLCCCADRRQNQSPANASVFGSWELTAAVLVEGPHPPWSRHS